MMRWVPIAVFALLGVALWVGLYREDRDVLRSTLLSEAARPFELPRLMEEGETFTQEDMKSDGPVVLNFWATWCPPCIAEHPEIMRISKLDGVKVFGINHQDNLEKAQRFLTRRGNPFTAVGFDPKGRTYIDYGVTAMPETFVMSGDGTVLYKHVGPINPGDFEEKILPAIERAR